MDLTAQHSFSHLWRPSFIDLIQGVPVRATLSKIILESFWAKLLSH